MQRVIVSIPSNIAEGQGRQHTEKFHQCLHIAVGSAAELDTQMVVPVDLGYVAATNAQPVFDLILEIRRMIYVLINKLPH